MDVYRQNTPPAPGPEFRIVRLRANEELTFLCASREPWGFWTHWLSNRSSPCFKSKKTCPGCRLGAPSRWKGYLFIVDQELKRECYLEVTPQAARSLMDQMQPGQKLRGLHLRVRRMGGDRARLKVQQLSNRDFSENMVEDRDPFPTLAKLWGICGPEESQLDRDGPRLEG